MILSTGQGEAIKSSGNLLITGGPGSGKTTVGLLKAKHRVGQGLLENQKLLFLSFSNSAVHQIRLNAGLRLDSGERAFIEIRTFHSLCFEVIRSFGTYIGIKSPALVLAPEDERLLKSRHERNQAEFIRQRKEMLTNEGRVSLELMPTLVKELLSRSAVLRKSLQDKYPLIIVDEFQDTSEAEWDVINLISEGKTLVCLADLDQRIYDFREGFSDRRIETFKSARNPKVIDLSQDNHRSPNSTILQLGNHVLNGTRPNGINGDILLVPYEFPNQRGYCLKKALRSLETAIKSLNVNFPSIGIFAATNKTILNLSESLSAKTRAANYSVRHQVISDGIDLMFAWRVVMSLLELAEATNSAEKQSATLSYIADSVESKGTKSAQTLCKKIRDWRSAVLNGKSIGRSKMVPRLIGFAAHIGKTPWSGNPTSDVDRILGSISSCADLTLRSILEVAILRPPCRANENVTQSVSNYFEKNKGYSGVIEIFKRSALNDRLSDSFRQPVGRSLLTMHKCKGREFDGVILFDGENQFQAMVSGDSHPFPKSRRLIRVALTRARHKVAIVYPKQSPSPVIKSLVSD